jgi:heme A synthase
MKKIMGSICLALFCLGVIGVEYEMALHFGSMLILFASVAFLGVLLVALFRAPEGYERFDGFHICQHDPQSRRVRGIRLARRARAARSTS